jgi:hypothetical protein
VAESVATAQGTASGTYVNLATTGPSVTLTVPESGRALVSVTAGMFGSTGNSSCYVGFEVTEGATVVKAPVDANALILAGPTQQQTSASFVITGLKPGASVTIQAKYRTSDEKTCTFSNRSIWAIPLP